MPFVLFLLRPTNFWNYIVIVIVCGEAGELQIVLLRFHFFNQMRLAAQGAIELGMARGLSSFKFHGFIAATGMPFDELAPVASP